MCRTIRSRWLRRAVVAQIVLARVSLAADSSGTDAPSVALTPAAIAKLRALIQTDAEASARFAEIKTAADAALAATADPPDAILTEGRLAKDPARIRTWQALGDMPKMHALGYAYVVTGDSRYADKARDFITAWAARCRPQGNPINDTNLDALVIAYDLTKSAYPASDRQTVDAYLRAVMAATMKTAEGPSHTNVNNWNSHRLKIEGLIAWTLQDAALIAHVTAAYKKQVGQNLNADGTSIDFIERDALHYHAYGLTPLLTLALAARNNGEDFYGYTSPGGSSLKKSVEWFKPYETCEKSHAEFVHSTVDFDRKRAASGQKEYLAGHPWDPKEGVGPLERAELWDPSLLPLTAKLVASNAQRFPTWQTLINAAAQ